VTDTREERRGAGFVPPMEFDPARAVPAPAGEEGAPLEGEVLPPARGPRRRWAVRGLVLAAAGLVLAGIGFDTADLLARAYAHSPWLGGAVAGLAGLLVACLGVMAGQELRAYSRLKKVDALRQEAEVLAARAGHGKAGPLVGRVAALYAGRPALAPARDGLSRALTDAHDDREALVLAERTLLAPVDREAYRLVLLAARDTAVATALSPAAILDVALVLWRNLRLVRQLAALYAARPGFVGTALLLRRMVENLAVAGIAETGDGLAVDALGGGLAGALSARIGQGVVNGLLTARVGLAAMHLCRPLPFTPETRPGLKRIRQELLRLPRDVL